jgi:hypothetical protein
MDGCGYSDIHCYLGIQLYNPVHKIYTLHGDDIQSLNEFVAGRR